MHQTKIIAIAFSVFACVLTPCKGDDYPSFDFNKSELKERIATFFEANNITIMLPSFECKDKRTRCEVRLSNTVSLAVTQSFLTERINDIDLKIDSRNAQEDEVQLFDTLCPAFLAVARKWSSAKANELYNRISRKMLNRWDGYNELERHQEDKVSYFKIYGIAGYFHCTISAK